MKQAWIRSGYVVMDGWIDIQHQPFINIIVTLPAISYFLKATDCSSKRKDIDYWFGHLKKAIDEVRSSNIVQAMTNSNSFF